MSAPPGSYYYDLVYGACEPCFSPTTGQNECVFRGQDPRDVGWIVDDEDVYPPDARGCAPSEKYDLLMKQCRPMCPGEGSGGQEYVYGDDTQSGSCMCYDPDHFVFNPESNTCIPKVASLQAQRRLRLNPGDPFPPCNVAGGLVDTCYYGDVASCLDVFAEAPWVEDDGGASEVPQAAMAAMARKARYESCPFMLCSTVNPEDCVCVGSQLGNRVQAVGKHKQRRSKK